MAKQPKKSAANDEDTTQLTTEPQQEFTPDDVAVMDLLAELGDEASARVRIYRQGKTYTDITLIHECAPGEFDPMMLAHPPYNGGEFRIHVRSRGGIAGNRLLKVAPSPAAIAALHNPTGVANATSADTLSIVREMMTGFQTSMQNMVTAMKPAEVNPLTTLEGIQKIAEIVKPAAIAPVERSDGFDRTMKAVETFLSMQERLHPKLTDADGEINPLNVGLALFREFKDAIKTAKEAQTPATVAATPLIANKETANQPALTPEESEEIIEMNYALRFQLKQANTAAINNVDAKEYADTVYALIPDGIIKMIAEDVEWFKKICEIVPACATHKAWYENVRIALIEFAKEDGLLTQTAAAATVEGNGNPDAAKSAV